MPAAAKAKTEKGIVKYILYVAKQTSNAHLSFVNFKEQKAKAFTHPKLPNSQQLETKKATHSSSFRILMRG